jgi:flavodoxin
MKTLVAYMSQTGNTKKVAEAIFGEISGDKEIKEIGEVDTLEGYDLAFIGFPIHGFGPAADAKTFMEKNVAGKRVALFVTPAMIEGGAELQKWLDNCKKAASGAEIVGMFDCQGELAQNVMDFLSKSDDPKMRSFGERGAETKGQPDESRLDKARAFARDVIAKLS